MRWIRARLARFAGLWLALQLAGLIGRPTALCATSAAMLGAECTCAHDDGGICPMHHTRTKRSAASDAGSCTCRSTADPLTAIAASIIGPPAVVAAPLVKAQPLDSHSPLAAISPSPVHWPSIPDAPPPRS